MREYHSGVSLLLGILILIITILICNIVNRKLGIRFKEIWNIEGITVLTLVYFIVWVIVSLLIEVMYHTIMYNLGIDEPYTSIKR